MGRGRIGVLTGVGFLSVSEAALSGEARAVYGALAEQAVEAYARGPHWLAMVTIVVLMFFLILLICFITPGRRGCCGVDCREDCPFVAIILRVLFGEIRTFQLRVLVHDIRAGVADFDGSAALVAVVKAGRERRETEVSKYAAWEEELKFPVRQGVSAIRISISVPGGKLDRSAREVGFAVLRVPDLVAKMRGGWTRGSAPHDAPMSEVVEETVHLRGSDGKFLAQLRLSFAHKTFLRTKNDPLLEDLDVEHLSGPMQDRLARAHKTIMAGQSALMSPHDTDSDWGSAPSLTRNKATRDYQELALLAKTLHGPVQEFGNWGHTKNRYLRVYSELRGPARSTNASPETISEGATLGERRWFLGLWDAVEFQKAKTRASPVFHVPVLRITGAKPDHSMKANFVITYRTDDNIRRSLVLAQVDRDRLTWCEALDLFIGTLRKYTFEARETRTAQMTQARRVSDSKDNLTRQFDQSRSTGTAMLSPRSRRSLNEDRSAS